MKVKTNTFVISDNHFRHWNINKYCNRGFSDLSDMESYMIWKWNQTIPPYGKVIILGDLAMTQGKCEEVKNVFTKLNGKKLLVIGNHDRKSHFWYTENGIDFICDSFTWYWNKKRILFIHNPGKVKAEDVKYYDYILHGHKHNTTPLMYREGDTLFINVSVENINYTPFNLLALLQKLQSSKWLKENHGIR
ncbi:MAG TPA: hypothetical protein ENI61_04220, partial [Ignavibacteria bacterium]|nr:hypothetical protein [Ignavibacteria bacterium]